MDLLKKQAAIEVVDVEIPLAESVPITADTTNEFHQIEPIDAAEIEKQYLEGIPTELGDDFMHTDFTADFDIDELLQVDMPDFIG